MNIEWRCRGVGGQERWSAELLLKEGSVWFDAVFDPVLCKYFWMVYVLGKDGLPLPVYSITGTSELFEVARDEMISKVPEILEMCIAYYIGRVELYKEIHGSLDSGAV